MCSKYAGAVAKTATTSLNNATLPYIIELAEKGVHRALRENQYLRAGLNIYRSKITCEAVARAHQLPYSPAEQLLC